MFKRRGLMVLFGLCLLASCAQPPRVQQFQGHAEGTTFRISWWADHSVDRDALRDQLRQALDQVDRWISNYRDDSRIEDFNRSTRTGWQTLPPDVVQLLSIAKTVYHDSHGCYDPTIEPLFDLWGFRSGHFKVPSAAQIAATKAEVGYDHVHLDPAHHRLRKDLPNLSIDMSSMGEGYSIWRLARVLEENGIHNYLVEFGGDMMIKGHKPDGSLWRIAIERPVPNEMKIQKVVTIRDQDGVSINTSGTYRHFFDEQGHSYSHILDARTGAPVTHNLVSASVIGSDPRVSDAWATAMLCLGQKQGMAVARRDHLKVFFIQQENGKLVESRSPALITSQAVSMQ